MADYNHSVGSIHIPIYWQMQSSITSEIFGNAGIFLVLQTFWTYIDIKGQALRTFWR